MLERLKNLYECGELSEQGLVNAVKRKWITEEQKEEIVSNKRDVGK